MDYDFMVGFTTFYKNGFKTRFRHFNKLKNAELFASNINIKENCKIYVDYLYYKKLERKIKEVIKILEAKPYTAYTLYGDILHESDEIAEILRNALEEKE